jgi:hypothetical protein
MNQRFRLVQLGNRGGGFYCKDILTGARTSLKTKNRAEAERLILHKNEALQNPLLNRKIGMAYLAGTDSAITKVYNDVADVNGCRYLEDYERILLTDLPTLYHAADSWQNFDKIAPVISQRFNEF